MSTEASDEQRLRKIRRAHWHRFLRKKSERELAEERFLSKLKEFEKIIRTASWRYSIPGVLDPDDLYQEGLIILDRMLASDYTYDIDPDSVDFRKMFKTELWHGLWHVLQKFKTQKRDWRKVEQNDFTQIELDASASVSRDSVLAEVATSPGMNPEQIFELRERIAEVDSFVDRLIDKLDDEARVVLHELLHPRSWDEIPEHLKTTQGQDEYWRVPKKIPQHVLAQLLDWPLIRVRRAIKRIRKHAGTLGDELGFELLAAAGIKKRRRKRSVYP